MAEQFIRSLTNPIVKKWVRLRTKQEAREQEGSALVIGSTIIKELLSTHTPRLIMIREHADIPKSPYCRVSDEVMEKVASLPMLPDWIAEFSIPGPKKFEQISRLLIIDGIKDPGNLGTLLRTALAFNWQHVFLLEGSADPFAPKALQATKGACFYLSIIRGSADDLRRLLNNHSMDVYLADLDGKAPDTITINKPCALVLGSEVNGVSDPLRKLGPSLTLPMGRKSESLNVAVAGGILMYLLRSDDKA